MKNEQKAVPKKRDNDVSMQILRKISFFIGGLIAKTRITPNQITVFNFLIFTPFIIYFLLQGTYLTNLFALSLVVITVILDLCDGVVARLKSLSSTYGAWLDASLDKIFHYGILASLIIGTLLATGELRLLYWGMVMFFGQAMADYIGQIYDFKFGFNAYGGSEEFNNKFANEKNISTLDYFLKNIIVPSKFVFIFLFTARYLLVLSILLNVPQYFIMIFAVTINLRWLSMYLLYIKFLSGTKSELKTVAFLNELSKKNV